MLRLGITWKDLVVVWSLNLILTDAESLNSTSAARDLALSRTKLFATAFMKIFSLMKFVLEILPDESARKAMSTGVSHAGISEKKKCNKRIVFDFHLEVRVLIAQFEQKQFDYAMN